MMSYSKSRVLLSMMAPLCPLLNRTFRTQVIQEKDGLAGVFLRGVNIRPAVSRVARPGAARLDDGVGNRPKLACTTRRRTTVGIDPMTRGVDKVLKPGALIPRSGSIGGIVSAVRTAPLCSSQ
jgi:phosphoribosylaminoimidazole (AIR) synthetase